MSTKSILTVISTTILSAALAFTLTAQEKKQEWKDQGEYDLFQALSKDANPTSRLASLDKWKQQYAQSDFADTREDVYLFTYSELKQPRQAIDKAMDILKTRPNNFAALSAVMSQIQALNPPPAADLDAAEKIVNYVRDNMDTVFAVANKPPNIPDAATWAQVKTQMGPYTLQTLLFIINARKDNPKAEQSLTALLQKDPTQSAVSYQLAGALLGQNKANPEKQVPALFHYARAAAYDGANSLPAATRTQVQQFLGRVYPQYHGSNEGLQELLALAKTNAMPPADFKITSKAEIEAEKMEKEQAELAKDPMMGMWRTIKKELTGDGGQAYFDSSVKDAGLPKFKGRIISMSPATRPKEIVLGVEKADVADAKIVFEEALAGKMEPGETLEFEGTGASYTKDPYMLVLDVEKEKLSGWTGKNAPAPRPAAKKAAPAAKKP